METIIRLKGSELNNSLIAQIKKFLASDNDSEIVISISKKQKTFKKETPAQTKTRIDRAIQEIENKRNLVAFTGAEFEKLTSLLSGK